MKKNEEIIRNCIFPEDIDENKLNRPWQIFDVIYDWDARIRGIIIEKVSDNTFRVLWTNGVIGEVVEASEDIYLIKNILNEINEEYDVNDAVAPCIEPDKFLSEKAIRIQIQIHIHISNPIVKTCVVRVVKDEEWFVATGEETAVTSQGKTIEDALANIKEALELYYSEEEEHFVSEIKKVEESVAKGNYITLDELHRNLDYDCNDKECNIISDEKRRLLLEKLKKRLENIKDSYFDFVDAIIHYAKRKQEHLDLLNKFLDEHPETSTSDVIYFVSIQPDFFEDSVPQKNGFIKKTENADETEAAEIDKLSPEDLEIVKTETITITKKRKVVKWTHWEDSRYPEVEWTGNWDDMRAYEMAIIEAIREHGYRMKGESHQRHPYGVPVFDDGTRYETTFRRWGSLMAEALGIEGEHAYVTWAFCVPPNETEVFPDPKDWE